jgi:hypothetical protein
LHNEPTSLTSIISVNQYAFDAFADSWLEDQWFTDEMIDSTAHSLMAINADLGLPASNAPPCAGSFNITENEKIRSSRFSLHRFPPVAPVKQTQWLTYYPQRRI